MRILKSIQARYRGLISHHFELSINGIRLKKFKNIHYGKRCFIIGNGPSLTPEDLNVIMSHDEISFAFNRIYYIFSQTDWRPTYFISQDEKMLGGCIHDVDAIVAKEKFIPIELRWDHKISIRNSIKFHICGGDGCRPEFSEDISRKIYNANTVVYSAIQIAYYMGIKEIYLIGVDHHFGTSMNSKGEIIIDPLAKDYFNDNYNNDKDDLYIPNTDLSTMTYQTAKNFGDKFGFQIFNATRGGCLEVFPRVNFDDLFK